MGNHDHLKISYDSEAVLEEVKQDEKDDQQKKETAKENNTPPIKSKKKPFDPKRSDHPRI